MEANVLVAAAGALCRSWKAGLELFFGAYQNNILLLCCPASIYFAIQSWIDWDCAKDAFEIFILQRVASEKTF